MAHILIIAVLLTDGSFVITPMWGTPNKEVCEMSARPAIDLIKDKIDPKDYASIRHFCRPLPGWLSVSGLGPQA